MAIGNGVLLPMLLVFIIRLVNNREVMGDYVNRRVYNVLAWATVVAVGTFSLMMVATTVLPALGGTCVRDVAQSYWCEEGEAWV